MVTSGRLEIIIGNMFSGKSTELIRRFNREKTLNKRILCVNYYLDNRYSNDNKMNTHDQNSVDCLKIEKLDVLFEYLNNYDSFFIDEAQFFSDLYSVVLQLVDVHKKHVVIAGLVGDYNRNKFGDIISLIPISDTVDKLSAYCNKCNDGTYGPFTKKIGSIQSTESTQSTQSTQNTLIEIGGKELYIPVCRYHYSQ
jgi:thymidine kinase